jgi:alcohol dehydrogenase class IV
MNQLHHFTFPTAITFGLGARLEAATHLQFVGAQRPLIVTDRAVADLPITIDFDRNLRARGLRPGIFAGVRGNPTAGQVAAGKAAFREHQADCVIGLGGGAALDVAKAVALMAVHEGDILDFAWGNPKQRGVERPLPYWIALPTTSGTGAEVGRSAVISDDRSHVKQVVFSPALMARAVFADPEFTVGLPPAITAATGIDALTHNIESYLSPSYHPICDGIALEGVRLAARALPAAFRDGSDLAARNDMMMASMMGAIAFQKDLGAVHSCAHALSAVLDLHHGLANGVMLDYVMRFNTDAARLKLAELARVAGAGSSADDFVAWLTRLKAELGIPAHLGEVGGTTQHLRRLVDIAFKDSCHKTNPRPCTVNDFERIFSEAL